MPTQPDSGSTLSEGTFTDTPTVAGDYWYDADVLDSGISEAGELWFSEAREPLWFKVTVNPASTTTYALTVSTAGSGTVTSDDGYITCGSSCTHTYNTGASVILTATPASGWNFSGWSGDCSGMGSCTVTMTATKTVTANYTGASGVVSLTATPHCESTTTPAIKLTWTLSGATASSYDLYRNGSLYPAGTGINGTSFDNYGSNVSAGGTYSYYVLAHLSSGGTLNSNTVNATAPADCSAPAISVTPTSQAYGSVAVGSSEDLAFVVQNTGSGTLSGTASAVAPFTITSGANYALALGASQSVTVRFSPTATQSYTQNITFTGGAGATAAVTGTGTNTNGSTLTVSTSGGGSVTSSDGFINCGSSCTHTYSSGASVILSATPASGWNFSGWSGACGSTGSCAITMSSTRAVSATFTQELSVFTISPIVIASGGTANLSIALSAPAPTGGAFISLTSSNPTTFPVPWFVIPAGQTTVSRDFAAGTTTTSTAVSVTASYNGGFLQATVTVNAAIVAPTVPVDFGTISIGQTSATTSLTFTFDNVGTLGSVAVLTGGATGLDFANAGTGTCTANTYSAGTTCTVDVTFTPKFAGLRNGVVLLEDSSGSAIATAHVHGTGLGPQISFPPGSQSTLGSGFSYPYGVAVDGSGNLFVADNGSGSVKEILAAGGYTTVKTLASGFSDQFKLAVDGSNNVFVADWSNNSVYEILAAGGYTTVRTLGAFGGATSAGPNYIAVDGDGNLFITWGKYGAAGLIEAFAASGYTTFKTLGGVYYPGGVAVDVSGNIYVVEYGSGSVKEILAADGYTTAKTLGSGLYSPKGVAVDVSGNIYVADFDYGSGSVKEILAAGGYTTVKTLASGFHYGPFGVAVDGSGNVFVADGNNNRVVKLDIADAPSLSFASTAVGSTSSDSPQSVTLSNNGNAALTFPIPSSGNNPSISGSSRDQVGRVPYRESS